VVAHILSSMLNPDTKSEIADVRRNEILLYI